MSNKKECKGCSNCNCGKIIPLNQPIVQKVMINKRRSSII